MKGGTLDEPTNGIDHAQRALIGALLVKPELGAAVFARVDSKVFPSSDLRTLVGLIQTVYEQGKEITQPNIQYENERQGKPFGSMADLSRKCIDAADVFPANTFSDHIEVLREAYQLKTFKYGAECARTSEDVLKCAESAIALDAGTLEDVAVGPADVIPRLQQRR